MQPEDGVAGGLVEVAHLAGRPADEDVHRAVRGDLQRSGNGVRGAGMVEAGLGAGERGVELARIGSREEPPGCCGLGGLQPGQPRFGLTAEPDG